MLTRTTELELKQELELELESELIVRALVCDWRATWSLLLLVLVV